MKRIEFIGALLTACILAAPQVYGQVADTGEPVIAEPIPEPILVRRVVASPRVAVAPNPGIRPVTSAAELADRCHTVGAAYNFARPSRRMLVKPNSHVFVQLGNDIEGVWYDGACGWLGAYIRVDVYDYATGNWKRLGYRYRTAKACGPNWGTVQNMGVRFVPGNSGDYLLRAQVISLALPLRRDLSYDRTVFGCRDVEVDYIFTKIRVVEDPTDDDLDWEAVEPQVDLEPVELVEM